MKTLSCVARTVFDTPKKAIELVAVIDISAGDVKWQVVEKRDYYVTDNTLQFDKYELARNCYVTSIETELISDDRPEE